MNLTTVSPDPMSRMFPICQEKVSRFSLTDITFEDDELWKPRYESLFDYDKVELDVGRRIEPSFQIVRDAATKVEITLEIAQPGVAFQTWKPESDRVVAYSVAEPRPNGRRVDWPAGLIDLRLDGGAQRCRLVWDAAAAKDNATTLRIACAGGQASGTDQRDLAKVEGGLWLTFVDTFVLPLRPRQPMPPNRGARPQFVVECQHDLSEDRFRYDVIRAQAYEHIPQGIEPELAFRVAGETKLRFGVALGAGLEGCSFEPAEPSAEDEIQVDAVQPRLRSGLALAPTQCQADGIRAGLDWIGQRPLGDVGSVSRFELGVVVKNPNAIPGHLKPLLRPDGLTLELGVDPTIIEPPSCDPLTGTCVPGG